MSPRSSIRKSELRELAASLSLSTEGLKSELDNRLYEYLNANPKYQSDPRFAAFYNSDVMSSSGSPSSRDDDLIKLTPQVEEEQQQEGKWEEEQLEEQLYEHEYSSESDSDTSYVELPTLYSRISDKCLIWKYLLCEKLEAFPTWIHEINQPIRYFLSDIRVLSNFSILIEFVYLLYTLIPWTYYSIISSHYVEDPHARHPLHPHLAIKVVKVPGLLTPVYKSILAAAKCKLSSSHDRLYVYSPDWEVLLSRTFLQFIAAWIATMVVIPTVVAYYINFTQREKEIDFAQLDDDNDEDDEDYEDDDSEEDEDVEFESELEEKLAHKLDEETKLEAVRHGESYEIDEVYDFENQDDDESESEESEYDDEDYQRYFQRLSGQSGRRRGTLAFIKDHMDPLVFSLTRIIVALYLLEPLIRTYLADFGMYTSIGHLVDNMRAIAVTGGVVGTVLSFWIARD